MNQAGDPFNPDLYDGAVHAGFQVRRIVPLPDIHAVFYELFHEKTGARYVHISRDDEENSFGVAFKTVPEDSTGVAHILEHTVLCGSKNYPVRDPFFSMIKRSLNSFMNAFTASDWTMYPFSSPNRKDFYNLMKVYLDAAFFPSLTELSFKQEGHRLEFEADPESGEPVLTYKGVVYNEMKGAMSSPDQVCRRSLTQALYPDTTYRFNSGGDPAVIPRLTYDALKAFHGRYYHPSNAFFYTYGNLPLKGHLDVIEAAVLAHFDRIDPNTEVPSQPRWNAPRRSVYYYPMAKEENSKNKSQACVAWLAADIREPCEVLILSLLEDILLGNAGSPMRKALMDSGLGTALCDATGFDPDSRDTLFSCGLKDMPEDAADKVEAVVMDVFDRLSREGIDRELTEAAIHQIEFHRKEVTNTPYPYGLKLLLTFSGSWLHLGDPVRALQFDKDMQRIRDSIAAGPFLENKIREYFIENPHRVLFELHPNPDMAGEEELRTALELMEIRDRLSPSEKEQIQKDAEALVDLQETKEDLSVLPTLARTDIPPTIRSFPAAKENLGLPGQYYEALTSGIFYHSAVFGMGMLPSRLLPLVPFFCSAVTRVGTGRRDYAEMAKRIDTYTGGVGIGSRVRTRAGADGKSITYLHMESKCLVRNQEKLFDILNELVGSFSFANHERLRQLLLEYRTGLESMIVHNGHRLAMSLAARRFMPQTALNEAWFGISQLQYVKSISENLDVAAVEKIAVDLTALGKLLFVRGNARCAYIGEMPALDAGMGFDKGLADALAAPDASFDPVKAAEAPLVPMASEGLPREGWYTSTAVSFVAQAFQTVRMNHPDAPALSVIAKMLRSLFIHREVREKGGAYGGYSMYSPEDGVFSFASYRDPRIAGTLATFKAASEFITGDNFADEDINEALLQVCSEFDKPDPPGPAARKAFGRKLVFLTDDMRREFKEALLSLTLARVKEAAGKYFAKDRPDHAIAVISGKEQLEAANRELGAGALSLKCI